MPGMTLEEMMAILNMEQQIQNTGGVKTTLGTEAAAAKKDTSAKTTTQVAQDAAASASGSKMEEQMFSSAGTASVGTTKIGMVSQTGTLDKMLAEATKNNQAKSNTQADVKTETFRLGALGVATVKEPPKIMTNEQKTPSSGQGSSASSTASDSSSSSSSVSSSSVNSTIVSSTMVSNDSSKSAITDNQMVSQPIDTMDISQMDPILGMFGNNMAALEQFISTGTFDPNAPVLDPVASTSTSTSSSSSASSSSSSATETVSTTSNKTPDVATAPGPDPSLDITAMERYLADTLFGGQPQGPITVDAPIAGSATATATSSAQMDLAGMERFLNTAMFDTPAQQPLPANPVLDPAVNVGTGTQTAQLDLNSLSQILNPAIFDAPINANTNLDALLSAFSGPALVADPNSPTISLADLLGTPVDVGTTVTPAPEIKPTTTTQGTKSESTQTAASFTPLGQIGSGSEFSWASTGNVATVVETVASAGSEVNNTVSIANEVSSDPGVSAVVIDQPVVTVDNVSSAATSVKQEIVKVITDTQTSGSAQSAVDFAAEGLGTEQMDPIGVSSNASSISSVYTSVNASVQVDVPSTHVQQIVSTQTPADVIGGAIVDTGPTQKEKQLLAQEQQAKSEYDILVMRQREELRRLEEQKREQQRQLMIEKQRIEYEKQQLALKKQQMELEALKKEQLRQRDLLEQQRLELEQERLRIEQERLRAVQMAKQRAAEEERQRQERIRAAELAKQKAAEEEKLHLAAEAKQRALVEAAAADAAAGQAAQATSVVEVVEYNVTFQQSANTSAAEANATQANLTAPSADASFTPIGAVGGAIGPDADAATMAAWQAVLMAAGVQPVDAAAQPAVGPAFQQPQILDPAWMGVFDQGQMQVPVATPPPVTTTTTTAPITTTPKPAAKSPSGLDALGLDAATLMKLLQLQEQQKKPSTPKPPAPKKDSKRKIPVRPDAATRNHVRQMFLDNMKPGVDPLTILIGLTPEMLMRSGVNPLVANSADLTQIVPAVERALGISLRMRPGRPGRPGRGAGPTSGLSSGPPSRSQSPRDRALARRQFLLEQRMMNEMLQVFGLGPEPLEPGDPGYRGPGGRGATTGGMAGGTMGGPTRGGAANPYEMTDAQQIAMERRMGASGGMGGGMGGTMGGGMGGAMGGPMDPGMGMGGTLGPGGPGAGLQAQMEMLGL